MRSNGRVRSMVLSFASMAALAATPGARAQVPADAPSTLCIEPAILDFGEIPTGLVAKRTITLTNTGDAPITITAHRASCGCTSANLAPNTVLPAGASRPITIPLNGGQRVGALNSPTITFVVKDQPAVKLTLKATASSMIVQEPAEISPEAHPDGCVTLRSVDGRPFRVLSMLPPLATQFSDEPAPDHTLAIDWKKYREAGVSRKLIFYFDHPLCPSLQATIRFSQAELDASAKEIGCFIPRQDIVAPPDPLGDVQTLITQGRNERILLRIVEGALDVNARNAQGQTLLAIAARAGNVDLMQTLLNAGADIEALDNSGRTPLMHAGTSKCAQAVRLLIDRAARIAVRDSIGGTALTWAAGFGDAACVQALLDTGAEVEIVGRVTGWTPLIWAAGFNDAAIVQILIRHGANLEAEDYLEGATPLIHAARTGKIESMWTLIRAGAQLEKTDMNGNTPLLAAAKNAGGDAEKVRLLIDAGANIHARDAAGRSALELAQRRTDPRAAEVVAVLQPR